MFDPPDRVQARPEFPAEVSLVQIASNPRHPHERPDAGPNTLGGERKIHVLEPQRGQGPVVPDERRYVHDRPYRDEVQKPADVSPPVGVPEFPGDRPSKLPGHTYSRQRILRIPELRVEDDDGW